MRLPQVRRAGQSGASYFVLARKHSYSLVMVLPLLLAYEMLVGLANKDSTRELRNAADCAVRAVLAPLGVRGTVAISVALVAVGAVLVLRERRADPQPIRGRIYVLMLGESVVLALAFGTIVRSVTAFALSPLPLSASGQLGELSLPTQLALALGAGVYEELVFRVIAVSGMVWLCEEGARLSGKKVDRKAAVAAAVLTSAVLFSVTHYVGAYGDAVELWSLTYRFVAGLAFSLLYALRGYGITAWTHSLYDVFLIVGGAV